MKINPTRKRKTKREEGFVLLTSYLLISVLSVFVAAVFARSMMFYQATERNKNRVVAFNLAESGLDVAITQLKSDATYDGTDSAVTLGSTGAYEVQVCPPSCDGLTEPTLDNVRLVKATGYAPSTDTTAPAYESRSVLSYVNIDAQTYFDYAIFADTSFRMTGNANIDSFNSNTGSYNAASPGSNGDIATNSTSDGGITFTGNSTVRGDAIVGPGSDPDDVIDLGSHGNITGTSAAATEAAVYSAPSTSTESSGAFSIAGSTNHTLAAGTYRYSSFSVGGTARVTATGPVRIFVDGNISLGGNGITTYGNKAPNFLLFSTGSGSVSRSGSAVFYGAIYAPNSAVTNSGSGAWYGAVVADTYTQNGSGALHFDEALMDVEGDTAEEIEMLSWQEMGTVANSGDSGTGDDEGEDEGEDEDDGSDHGDDDDHGSDHGSDHDDDDDHGSDH